MGRRRALRNGLGLLGAAIVGLSAALGSQACMAQAAFNEPAHASGAASAVFGLDGLAAKGAVLAGQDPMAAEMRKDLPDASARRGFDIGLAVAEGQTLPGPGKQKIHDSLAAAEQEGFSIAVAYTLPVRITRRSSGAAVSGLAAQ